ncbi:cation acetate symporter [Streptomyces sp. NBC_00879]|uniref:solute symporter family protein n=1 Tax=Streptomyces sp. NBC_00879 TaxID=2975855 RepID=UPI00386E36BC|nr:cation acetate symporter [Streptomyces sp. NBC_00879]
MIPRASYSDTVPVFTIFAAFGASTLFLSLAAVGRDTLSNFYLGHRRLSWVGNGLAVFGIYMSAAGMLSNPGLVSLRGYDGILYVLASSAAWIVLLVVITDAYHGSARFTVGDSLARRLSPRPTHMAAGVVALLISLVYLIAQLVGAGTLAAPILGLDGAAAQRALVACLGTLMILSVVGGGMRAATAVQCVKAVLLLAGGAVLALAVLSRFGWNPAALLSAAADHSALGDDFLRPGAHADEGASALDALGLELTRMLGSAGLPHVLMRIGTVATAREARRSIQFSSLLIICFSMAAVVIGLGAAGLLGTQAIASDSPSGKTAVLLLADSLGGSLTLTAVSCLAFITIMAVVTGLILTAAASLAHDIYGATIRRGKASEQEELAVARGAVLLIGAGAITLSMFAQDLNLSFLVELAFAIAASAILPTILYNLWWRGFTARGATWSLYGGLLTVLLLMTLSRAVSGHPAALLPDADFAIFPMRNPGLVCIPVGFLLGWLGSVLDTRRRSAEGAGWHSEDQAAPASTD